MPSIMASPLNLILSFVLWLHNFTICHVDSSDVFDDTPSIVPRPNIMFLMARNIAIYDPAHSECTSSSLTPSIDSLITTESLYLSHHYVPKTTTLSRATFLSGRYPSNIGLYDIDDFEIGGSYSMTRQISTISEEFKMAGYSTHFIGSWQLGMTSREYTPTYRGFDTFSGSLGAASRVTLHGAEYHDLWENEEEVLSGDYGLFWERDKTLDLMAELKEFEDPFFIYIAWSGHLDADEAQRIDAVDTAIADIVDDLKSNGLWDSTLMVFVGGHDTEDIDDGSNSVQTAWEGTVRAAAFVTGGVLGVDRRGVALDGAMTSMADWYPTLLSAAGIEAEYPRSQRLYGTDSLDTRFGGDAMVSLDGMDLWTAIKGGDIDHRIKVDLREILLDLDPFTECPFTACGALRAAEWKFVRGPISKTTRRRTLSACLHRLDCDEEIDIDSVDDLECSDTESGCLFNVDADPCELDDVGHRFEDLRQEMAVRLDAFKSMAIHSDTDSVAISPPFQFIKYEDVRFEDVLRRQFVADSVISESSSSSNSSSDDLVSASAVDADGSTAVHRILVFGMILFATMTVILICVFLQLGNKKKKKGGPVRDEATPLMQ